MLRIVISYIIFVVFIISAILFDVLLNDVGVRGSPVKIIEQPSFLSSEFEKINNDAPQYKYVKLGEYLPYSLYRDIEEKNKKLNVYSGNNVNITTYGFVDLKLKYGKSIFTDNKYKQYSDDVPLSRVVSGGFIPEQVMVLHMDGDVGDRISIYIDHDSRKENNNYVMNYRAISDNEIIREINAGDIDLKFSHSKYAVYDSGDTKALGMDLKLRKGKFKIKAFAAVSKGETMVEYFTGNSTFSSISLSDYQFVRKTYYQLEPFIRYDGLTSIPDAGEIYSMIAVTSSPPDPSSYTLNPVNIATTGFALYMDDQNPYNNYNAIQLSLDGGYYTKLSNGTDYSINYITGVIKIIKLVPENSRIFAVYNVDGGTRDPCVLTSSDLKHPGGCFSGKNFVFIRYGYSINEDTSVKDFVFNADENDVNGDGRVNLDLYEIRSYYYLGSKNILSSNFVINFYKNNQRLSESDISNLTKYSLNLDLGLLNFKTREPYRSLLSLGEGDRVYSEVLLADSYLNSIYKIKADYSVEARSFQLKKTNVIENSVKIKINGAVISKSLYSVDYVSGCVAFTNLNNPVITSGTDIEIKYEYLPFGAASNEILGGMRADYNFNKNLRVGGTMLFAKGIEKEIIPDIGSEREQSLLLEGDATLYLDRKTLAQFYNIFSEEKKERLPFEIRAYGEHVRNYREINNFGKALIDNMESTDEIVSISMSEKDWILSSMPDSFTQSDRGLLYYSYYRNPSSPDLLKGITFSSYDVNYQVKPGPYNIAMGNVDDSIIDQDSQKSLVMDFDFSSGSCVSIATRQLASSAVDMSGLQYVELWVRYDGESDGDSVNLYIDLGTIDEDSDGDGVMDREDVNNNGYIDVDSSGNYSEDRGYAFNGNNFTVIGAGPGLSSFTEGDGILNSEDLNGNGTLDGLENVYTVNLGTVIANGDSWRKLRVYIKWDNLTLSEMAFLRETSVLRLYATRGTGERGKLYLDGLKLVTSKWKNPKLDGIETGSSDRIKTTFVNSINDSDYRMDSFLLKQTGLYESLYGDRSSDELVSESESALQIEFDIPQGNDNVSVERTFSKSMDLRFYKTLNIWVNARNFSAGNILGIIIGSSDYDYVEYRAVPNIQIWQNLKFSLSGSSEDGIEKYFTSGNLDEKRINFIKVIIYGNGTSGKLWLNEIYVSDPEIQKGSAYWSEGEVNFKEPFYRTAGGTPVLSDMNIKYIYRGHSSLFTSLGKTNKDISDNYREFSGNTELIPNWKTSIIYSKETAHSDSLNESVVNDLRGKVEIENFSLTSVFLPQRKNLPFVNFSYNYYDYLKLTDQSIKEFSYSEKKAKDTHSPVIFYNQSFDDFLFGKLNIRGIINLVLSNKRVEIEPGDRELQSLDLHFDIFEVEKRQKIDTEIYTDYNNNNFFIKQKFNISSEEIVELAGSDNYQETGIYGELKGNYHFPFVRSGDMRYVERENQGEWEFGLKNIKFMSPSCLFSFNYRDNGFMDSDRSGYFLNDRFIRTKNTNVEMISKLTLPIKLNNFDLFKKINHFNISYFRSVTLSETDVPYEGEDIALLDEKYGISHVFGSVSQSKYGFFNNYPGFYFTGRGNYASARDYVFNTLNRSLNLDDSTFGNEYDNTLKFLESCSTDLSYSTNSLDLSLNMALNQICERSNIDGIPSQVVSATGGINIQFNLINIFNFWFLKSNSTGLAHYSSSLNIGTNYSENMIITSNVNEKVISSSSDVVFKWDRSSLGIKTSIEYRKKQDHEYISDNLALGDSDYIYIENMAKQVAFHEVDNGYLCSAVYETDVSWIYDYFSLFYNLSGIPVFKFEYLMEFNRYDYFNTVSPEPYDMFYVKSGLVLNLHKNVKGGIDGLLALERYRNRDTEGISSEVFSYELSANFSLMF